jgi:enoyl-CoA hydratase/carnithine racemase
MGNEVLYESKDGIAVVTLNRPEKLNALDRATYEGLAAAWQRFETGEDRVAILTGAGRAFSAGADLDEADPNFLPYVPGVDIPVTKPLVCAVNGLCVGGALALLQYADLAVAAEDAWFSYPEPQLGGTGGLITALATRIPHKIAMEIMLCGDRLSARRAYEVGLVNRVVPEDRVMETARAFAERLAANAPLVVRGLKAAVADVIQTSPAEMAGKAQRLARETCTSADYQEGIDAWAERRAPDFKGR